MANRLTKGKGLFGAVQIGAGGAAIKGWSYGTLSVVHGTVLPTRMGTVSMAFSGLGAADIVNLQMPASPTAGLGYAGHATAAGSIHVFVVNPTSGTVSPGTLLMPYLWHDLT